MIVEVDQNTEKTKKNTERRKKDNKEKSKEKGEEKSKEKTNQKSKERRIKYVKCKRTGNQEQSKRTPSRGGDTGTEEEVEDPPKGSRSREDKSKSRSRSKEAKKSDKPTARVVSTTTPLKKMNDLMEGYNKWTGKAESMLARIGRTKNKDDAWQRANHEREMEPIKGALAECLQVPEDDPFAGDLLSMEPKDVKAKYEEDSTAFEVTLCIYIYVVSIYIYICVYI